MTLDVWLGQRCCSYNDMFVFFRKQHAVTSCPTILHLSSKYQHAYVCVFVCAWNWARIDPQFCGVCLLNARHAQQDEFAEPRMKHCFSLYFLYVNFLFHRTLVSFSTFSAVLFLQKIHTCVQTLTHSPESLQGCCVCTVHCSACTNLWIMPINLPSWQQMASHLPVSQTWQHFISNDPSHQQPVWAWRNRDATCKSFQCACVTLTCSLTAL